MRLTWVLLLTMACGPGQRLEALVAPVELRGVAVALPAPPAEPVLTPCPPGWRTLEGPPASCEPWPAGTALCPEGELLAPGDERCSRIGLACPAGDWLEAYPSPRPVLFVKAGAPPGGSGTRARPFATLAEAFNAPGVHDSLVALSKGTHRVASDEVLPEGVHLMGACVAETTLSTLPGAAMGAALYVLSPGNEVRNLRIVSDVVGVAVWGGTGAALVLEDVEVLRATGVGVFVRDQGRATLRRVAIRDTRTIGADLGVGLYVTDGSTVTAERAVLAGNPNAGVSAFGRGATVTVRDTRIVGRPGSPAPTRSGIGVALNQGAAAVVERVVIEASQWMGVQVNPDASLELRDSVVRGSQRGFEAAGNALRTASARATVVRRTLIEDNAGSAVVAVGGPLVLSDVVLRRNALGPEVREAAGLRAQDRAVVTAERLHLERHAVMSVAITSGASLALADATVVETAAETESGFGLGLGLALWSNATAQLQRVHIERSRVAAIQTSGATLTLEDVMLRDTRATNDDPLGVGAALFANRSTITATRLVVDGSMGSALDLSEPGTFTGTNVWLKDSKRCTPADACTLFSSGLYVHDGARAQLSRFRITDNGGLGVLLALGGEADLTDGEISRHLVGVNVMTMPFDVQRVSTRVQLLDNGQRLLSTTVPLPPKPPELR